MKKIKTMLVMLLAIMMMVSSVSITGFASTNAGSLSGLYSHFIEPLPTNKPAENTQSFYDQWAAAGHTVPGLLNFFKAANTTINQNDDLKNGDRVGRLGADSIGVILRDDAGTAASVCVENDNEWSIKFSAQDGSAWKLYDSLAVIYGDNGNLNLGGQSDSKIGFQYDFKYENPKGNKSTGSYSGLTYSTGYYGNFLAVAGYGGAEFYTGGNSQSVESFRPVLQANTTHYTMCYGGRSVLKNDRIVEECFAGDCGLEYGKWYTMRVIFDCINTKMSIYIFKEDGSLYISREVVNEKYKNIQPGFRLASCPLLDTYFKNVYVVREGMYVNGDPVIETDGETVKATAKVRLDAKLQGMFNQGINVDYSTGVWSLKSPSLILALYSKADGSMIDCKTVCVDGMNKYGTDTVLTAELNKPSEEYYVKAFVWRDLNGMYPYISSVSTNTEAE